jgi:hypothetical protein
VFSGEVYDFYSVSPEYIGYTLIHGLLINDNMDQKVGCRNPEKSMNSENKLHFIS